MNIPITTYDVYLNIFDVLSPANIIVKTSIIITPINNIANTGPQDNDIYSGFKYAIADNPRNNINVVKMADTIKPF